MTPESQMLLQVTVDDQQVFWDLGVPLDTNQITELNFKVGVDALAVTECSHWMTSQV